jgi:ribonuclease P protein component
VPGGPSSLGAVVEAATGSRPDNAATSLVVARTLRLHRAEDFRATFRRGRRCSTATVVVHALFDESEAFPRIGFVVSKSVGMAVQRNRVKRRLRAVMNARLATLPSGRVVVRALPAAAAVHFQVLSADVDRCLDRLTATVP